MKKLIKAVLLLAIVIAVLARLFNKNNHSNYAGPVAEHDAAIAEDAPQAASNGIDTTYNPLLEALRQSSYYDKREAIIAFIKANFENEGRSYERYYDDDIPEFSNSILSYHFTTKGKYLFLTYYFKPKESRLGSYFTCFVDMAELSIVPVSAMLDMSSDTFVNLVLPYLEREYGLEYVKDIHHFNENWPQDSVFMFWHKMLDDYKLYFAEDGVTLDWPAYRFYPPYSDEGGIVIPCNEIMPFLTERGKEIYCK